jgi:proteic killer suppression protein
LVLSFASKSLREICEDEEHATQQLAKNVTRSLRHRLADLEAAGSVRDLIAGRPRKRTSSGNYEVRLADGFCLEFAANHVKNPVDKNEEVDWNRVNRIQIVRIGRCHD